MVEAAVAVFVGLGVLLFLAWLDSRSSSEWEDLLSPDLNEAQRFMSDVFLAEERAARFSGSGYVAGVAEGRLAIVRKLSLYHRVIAAAVPAPERMKTRLRLLRVGFGILARPNGGADALAALDREALESCRILATAAAQVSIQR